MNLLLPTAYLPPVSYLRYLLKQDNVRIEGHEHFVKQTLRNRCEIYGANGRLRLTVPVDHTDRWRKPIREIKVRNDEPWKRLHLKSIISAYGKSPFFEFYADELHQVFRQEYSFLLDLNVTLLQLFLKWLKSKKQITITDTFIPYSNEPWDARSSFNDPDTALPASKNNSKIGYYQVFEERHGFQTDLSGLDLIFNTGPEAVAYLQ
jgi:hypothetical protein